MDGLSLLARRIGSCHDKPLDFVKFAFTWGQGDLAEHTGPDVWQEIFLRDLQDALADKANNKPLRFAVASGNGIGKGTMAAWLTLWAISVRPNLRGVVTANTQDQLRNKTWAEVGKWYHRMIHKDLYSYEKTKLMRNTEIERVNWFIEATPFNKENPDAFQGIHADDVIIIFDEAAPIPESIYDAVEGALTTNRTMFFCFGNPTRNRGKFKEIFSNSSLGWDTRHVDSRSCRLTNKDTIEQWKDIYGEDSDFFRTRVKGEFPSQDSGQFIPEDLIRSARNRPVQPDQTSPMILGVDIARYGDDKTVFIVRQGFRIMEIQAYQGLNTITVANHIQGMSRNEQYSMIFIDEVGIGAGVFDTLVGRGVVFEGINGGSKPEDAGVYKNKKTEMWGRVKTWLEKASLTTTGSIEASSLNEKYVDILCKELAQPEYTYDPEGRLLLESKRVMKHRGMGSPDFADALALTFAYHVEDDAGRRFKPIRLNTRWSPFGSNNQVRPWN